MNGIQHYTIYDIESGEVLRNIDAHDYDTAEMQVEPGEGLVSLKLDYMKHYIHDRKVREYTPAERERKANPPSLEHTWNQKTRRWEDRRTADAIQVSRNNGLKAEIVDLEFRQHRALREATLTGDNTKLREIDNKITALRAQIKD
jgi:hypothetical protein